MRYEYEPNQFTKVNSTSCDDSVKHLQAKYIRQRCGSLGAKLREDQYIIAYIVAYMARSFQENVFVLLTSIPHINILNCTLRGGARGWQGQLLPPPPPPDTPLKHFALYISCEWGLFHLRGYSPYPMWKILRAFEDGERVRTKHSGTAPRVQTSRSC